ncbi:hypothetical protein BD94_2526 [Elizabethkingia anophelis NUHP1]|uniref:Uncharacterized protein n=1 Tax=Elizabethkingia anophelis NUHP1 TaxID=1338011 RepID=A0A077EF67_9FLAO|nr:hypothetical protein BD94_2526 [Elizabethkingia anophelis NUHP1]BBQ05738.1 hypothetical protein JUNP353_0309 [Elizabethkingia anophelis]
MYKILSITAESAIKNNCPATLKAIVANSQMMNPIPSIEMNERLCKYVMLLKFYNFSKNTKIKHLPLLN